MVSLELLVNVSDSDIGLVLALSTPRHREFIYALMNQQQIESHDPTAKRLFPAGDTVAELHEELNQTHLPLLDEAGFIEWDRESGMVRRGPRFDEITALLESAKNDENSG